MAAKLMGEWHILCLVREAGKFAIIVLLYSCWGHPNMGHALALFLHASALILLRFIYVSALSLQVSAFWTKLINESILAAEGRCFILYH